MAKYLLKQQKENSLLQIGGRKVSAKYRNKFASFFFNPDTWHRSDKRQKERVQRHHIQRLTKNDLLTVTQNMNSYNTVQWYIKVRFLSSVHDHCSLLLPPASFLSNWPKHCDWIWTRVKLGAFGHRSVRLQFAFAACTTFVHEAKHLMRQEQCVSHSAPYRLQSN